MNYVSFMITVRAKAYTELEEESYGSGSKRNALLNYYMGGK